MPNLPTFQVTEEQAARLLAAFESVDAYKTWLKTALIDYVTTFEAQAAMLEIRDTQLESQQELRTQLLGETPPV